MARPVHPSHPPQQAPHSGAAGAHPDPHAPAGAPAKPSYGKRALENASDVVENWAAQRTRRPLANSGIGNAAREAMGGLTKGSQALAAGGLHNQDPYSVASVASETVGAARTVGTSLFTSCSCSAMVFVATMTRSPRATMRSIAGAR